MIINTSCNIEGNHDKFLAIAEGRFSFQLIESFIKQPMPEKQEEVEFIIELFFNGAVSGVHNASEAPKPKSTSMPKATARPKRDLIRQASTASSVF